ncbi:unnamed protein product [Moneuplotes crassus]|uniref:Uncharacterized protein n=1 Tax=Euplotes crassus TaxID=5936 RepID=A0AAD1U286_EUPCR|nr:unnamed protein product [Moneuplotes crassus]
MIRSWKWQRNSFKLDSMEQLSQTVDFLKLEIDERAKINFVKNQVDSLSNEFKEVISDFATHQSVASAISIIEAKIKKVKRDFKRELECLYVINERIEKLKEEAKLFIKKGPFEAKVAYLDEKLKDLDSCCKFEHLEAHMNRVEPMIQQCRKGLDDYKDDNQKQKEILSRFDEVLLQKASKFSVEQIETKLRDYSLKADFTNLLDQINIKTNENKSYIREVQNFTNKTLSKANSDIISKIYEMEKAVRARTNEFLEKNTIKPDEIKKLLAAKANYCDVMDLKKKADITETNKNEIRFKTNEKQAEHIIVLLIETLRLNLKESSHFGKSTISQFKYILKQAITIFQWMTEGKTKREIFLKAGEEINIAESESGMLKVRQIHSSLDRNPHSFSTTNPLLANATLDSVTRPKNLDLRDDWLGCTFESGLNSTILQDMSKNFTIKQNNSQKASPRIVKEPMRLHTSKFSNRKASMHLSLQSRKSRVQEEPSRAVKNLLASRRVSPSNKVPNANFPDPIPKRTKRISLIKTSTALKDMVVKGERTMAKQRQDLRETLTGSRA